MSAAGASLLVPLVLGSGQSLFGDDGTQPGSAWLIHVRPAPAWWSRPMNRH